MTFYLWKSENLFITAAATQGIHLATTVLLSKDVPIFVEDPTFFIAPGMFHQDYGYRVIPGKRWISDFLSLSISTAMLMFILYNSACFAHILSTISNFVASFSFF